MAAEKVLRIKQLALVVDGTAAMAPYWSIIVKDYIEKIVRYFCGHGSAGQGPSESDAVVEFGLVIYTDHEPCSPFLVRANGWTRDLDRFLSWLSGFIFSRRVPYETLHIAQGLAEALKMFSTEPHTSQPFNVEQKHCILVAATDPFLLSTLSNLPKIQETAFGEQETQIRWADVQTVAKSFTQCSVSLSVISPKQLPKLREIFSAGNSDVSAAEHSFNGFKNPEFLVLLSEKFLEARAALYEHQPTTTSSLQSTVNTRTNLVSKDSEMELDLPGEQLLDNYAFSEEDVLFLQQLFSENPPTLSKRAKIDKWSPMVETQDSLITCATPIAGKSKHFRMLGMGKHTLYQGMVSSAMTSEALAAATPISAQNTVDSSFPSPQPETLMGNSLSAQNKSFASSVPRPFAYLERDYLPPRVNQHGFGQSGASPGAGTSNPTAELVMPEAIFREMEFATMTVQLDTNQQENNIYVKAWEGNLSARKSQQIVILSRVVAYRKTSTRETITSGWPETLYLGHIISREFFNDILHHNQEEYIILEAKNNHNIFGNLKEKKYCSTIKLPSQTMILCPTEKVCCFIGTIYPKDFPLLDTIEPPTPTATAMKSTK